MIALLLAAQLLASETNPLAWSAHRDLADWLSTGGVVASLALDTRASWTARDRAAAFRCQALRMVSATLSAEATKALIHRTRPDGSDRKSFFSEHAADAAASATGWKAGLFFTMGVGYGRLAANRHYTSDVFVGGVVGGLTHLVCH